MGVGGIMLALITGMYMILTSLDKVPLHVAILFTVIAFEMGFFVHYVFKKAAEPFSKSLEIQARTKGIRDAYVRRFRASCQPIKFGLGDGGFFDDTTSLVVWQMCVDELITILFI
jgi:hypothetical protein